MNNIDWSKAPDWATKFGYLNTFYPVWYNEEKYMYYQGDRAHYVYPFILADTFNLDNIRLVQERPVVEYWVDGLPPVGSECEVYTGAYWFPAEVLGRAEDAVWVYTKEEGAYRTIKSTNDIRPIRTPEQQQREDLVELMSEAWQRGGFSSVADAILSKYNLTEKE